MVTQETPRRRFAEQLPALASALYDSDVGIVALDADWIVTAWNRGAERMYGLRADDVLGCPVADLPHLDMTEELRAALRRTTIEEGRWSGEVGGHHKDGTPIWVDLRTATIRDERGKITGYIGVHRDATQRKQAAADVETSQRQVESVLQNMGDAYAAVDAQWRVTYMNDRGLQRIRAQSTAKPSLEEVIGTELWSWAPGAEETEAYRRLHQAMAERRPVEFQTHFTPSGEWVETAAYPSETGLAIFWHSIDARKRAQADSERAAVRQAAVAELGLRALAGEDVQTLMDAAVEVSARMLDVGLVGIGEVLPGRRELLFRAGVGWAAADLDPLLGYTLRTGQPAVSVDLDADPRFPIVDSVGGERPVSGISVPIAGGDEPFGALGAFSRTPRRFEADDVSFLQTLANIVSTTVEHAAAQKRLVEVREAERRRIARDLHDEALQTLAFAQVQAVSGEGDATDRLEALRPALDRIGEQLRGAIFDLRLGTRTTTPFTELLTELVELQRALASDCTIDLTVGDGVPTGALGARGTEMLRILGEALNNARRHSGASRIHIDVHGTSGRLVCEVVDNGSGFDVGLRTAGHGTGLGAMHERSELIDARLEIRAGPGGGTRLILDVPVREQAGDARPPLRILVVEDEQSIREAIAWMLDREPDLEVVAQARLLEEARGLLQDIDVAVVDLGLPDGFGGDLVPDLRGVNPRAETLVLTASIDDEEISRAYESGATAVLNKVAQLARLPDAVRGLARRAPAA